MDGKDLYLRKQYTARRGASKKRMKELFFKVQNKKRELIPKWSKWGNLDIRKEANITPVLYDTRPRREGHEQEKEWSRLNKNYRRTLHPIKEKRDYWKKSMISTSSERDPKRKKIYRKKLT